ncbi:hypothetical protein HPB51_000977 [Rhipicephalus microplus]|uniref:Uncharacterized protein n=1 Tax=Rhipicephalus microplus TaxID=6941 RepID=A0A9J6DE44_RHIMP|nr:hypothetical protein HPB51_000977 [Rhipicephalus microplus]
MTSPVTWPVSPLQNHTADAVSLGHDTASHTMLNPLLTLQMLVCFIATSVCPSLQDKLGSTYPPAPRNLAWETGPPLDTPDPAAPPKPAQWPPYSWQPSPSVTSPVTWTGVTATKPHCRCCQFGARHRKPHHAQPASDFAATAYDGINLLFLGIKDNIKETWEESEQKISTFCADKLKVTLEPGAMERAHRIGTFSENKTRPIIVNLAHYKTKERILNCGRMPKDNDFAIREDFAAATRIARSKLLQFIRPQKCAFKLSLGRLHVDKMCFMYDQTFDKTVEIGKKQTVRAIAGESLGMSSKATE